MSVLQNTQQDYVFGNKEIQKLVNKYAKILRLSPMSQTYDQLSADEKDIRNDNRMEKTMTTRIQWVKFIVLENTEVGTLKTSSDILTYTMKNDEKFTFLFQLLNVCSIFQACSANAERLKFNE